MDRVFDLCSFYKWKNDWEFTLLGFEHGAIFTIGNNIFEIFFYVVWEK